MQFYLNYVFIHSKFVFMCDWVNITSKIIFLIFFQPVAKKEKKEVKDKSKNCMRDLHIRKLCLNICVGESGDRLTRAAKVPIEPPISRFSFYFWAFLGVRTINWTTARIFQS